MSDLFDCTALITALIVDRPLCLRCIAERSDLSEKGVQVTLRAIACTLVLKIRVGDCVACGAAAITHSIG